MPEKLKKVIATVFMISILGHASLPADSAGEKTVLAAGTAYFKNAPFGHSHACYWENGEIIPLYGTDYSTSEAHTVLRYNGSIYISGWVYDHSRSFRASYWINDEKGIEDLGPGRARGMTVSDSIVYTAGHYISGIQSYPCYWINNERFVLSSLPGWATGIDFYNNNIYVSGREWNGTGFDAGYWVNGEKVNLISDTGAFTNIAAVRVPDSSSIYAAGTSGKPGSYRAYYWKNGSENMLPVPPGADEAKATGMFVYGDDVYVSGYYLIKTETYACYWKNSEIIILDPLINSGAYSIHVFEGLVYAAGHTYESGIMRSCVWIDGIRTYIGSPGSAGYSVFTSRFSKPVLFTENR